MSEPEVSPEPTPRYQGLDNRGGHTGPCGDGCRCIVAAVSKPEEVSPELDDELNANDREYIRTLEAQAVRQNFIIACLVDMAGGKVRVPMNAMVMMSSDTVIKIWTDPVSGEDVIEIEKPHE